MKGLLRIKHWQLFILLVGIPFILQIFFIYTSLVSRLSPTGTGLSPFVYSIMPVTTILFIAIYFSWLYAIGSNLQSLLPVSVKMNLLLFRWLLLIPIIYMLCLSAWIFTVANSMITTQAFPNMKLFLLIVPVHFFCMFCIFYCFYFNAKSIKSVQLQRPVKFDDYAAEFFLLWFFPIGIWILQPRLNKIFDNKSDRAGDLLS
jgi:hypothetical protein